MQAPALVRRRSSPLLIPPRLQNLRRLSGAERRVPRKHNLSYRGARRPTNSKVPSSIAKGSKVVQTFQVGPESPSHGGQSVPKHRLRAQKRREQKEKRSSLRMAQLPRPKNSVDLFEATGRTLTLSNAIIATEGQSKGSKERPSSAPQLRESRNWAKSNAKCVHNREGESSADIPPRRASEDLLRIPPPSSARSLGNTDQQFSGDPGDPANCQHLSLDRTLKCLGGPHNTRNWLGLRAGNNINAPSGHDETHKVPVHHQVGRLVKKITDAGNWATKEPTPSLELPDCQVSDSQTQTTPNSVERKLSLKHKLSFRERANMYCFGAKDNSAGRQDDNFIDLNTAGGTPNSFGKTQAPLKQDVEDEHKRSTELSKVFTRHPPHSTQNLGFLSTVLPDINTDAFIDVNKDVGRSPEQYGITATCSSVLTYSAKVKPLPAMPGSGPRPGVRTSSKGGTAALNGFLQPNSASDERHSFASTKRSGQTNNSTNPHPQSESLPHDGPTKGLKHGNDEHNTARQSKASINVNLISGARPAKSIDTLGTINIVDTSLNNQPLTPSNSVKSATGSSKLPRPAGSYSRSLSLSKSPGQAPNRPLPALPELATPTSSAKSRRETSSQGSSISRRSFQRTSILAADNHMSGLNLDGPNDVSKDLTHRRSSKSGSSRPSPAKSQKRLSSSGAPVEMKHISESTCLQAPSPEIRQDQVVAKAAQTHLASREERVRAKKLRDIESDRIKRGKKLMVYKDQVEAQEGRNPTVEDFPQPPSRSSSFCADQTLTEGNVTGRFDPQSPVRLHCNIRNQDRATSSMPITDSQFMPRYFFPRHSKAKSSSIHSTHSAATNNYQSPTHRPSHSLSRSVHGAQTPPLSESSDEQGNGVLGSGTSTSSRRSQKKKHHRNDGVDTTATATNATAASQLAEIAALRADMQAIRHVMEEQMQAQARQLQWHHQNVDKEKEAIAELLMTIQGAMNEVLASPMMHLGGAGGKPMLSRMNVTEGHAAKGREGERAPLLASSEKLKAKDKEGRKARETNAREMMGLMRRPESVGSKSISSGGTALSEPVDSDAWSDFANTDLKRGAGSGSAGERSVLTSPVADEGVDGCLDFDKVQDKMEEFATKRGAVMSISLQ